MYRRESAAMFSQRKLIVCAWVAGLSIFVAALAPWLMVTIGWRPKPPEIITDQDLWPEPLRELFKSKTAIAPSVTVLRLDAFVDQKSVSLITNAQKLPEELIRQESLETASAEHPKLKELQKCLPATWRSPNLSSARIWASPGYGTEHIEGPNLLLVVHNPDTDCLYILHERIF